jgi:AraC-type DNA-binding domain-containing proteins
MDEFIYLSKQTEKKYPPLVQDAIAVIEAEYSYIYGIDELSERLEVTKHHLIRMFTGAAGISPGRYLIDVRMAHAKFLLKSGKNTPLEIIAGACGYSCANYFSKVFKKHSGMTPTEFMKSAEASSECSQEDHLDKFYL